MALPSLVSELFINNAGKDPTHHDARTGTPFSVGKEDKRKFWTTVLDQTSRGQNTGLYERIDPEVPTQLSFEIKIPFSEEIADPQALTETVDRFVDGVTDAIQGTIDNCVDVNRAKSELVCCYLRRKESVFLSDENPVFSGRLIFPFCRVTTNQAEKLFHQAISVLQERYRTVMMEPLPKVNVGQMVKLTESPRPMYLTSDGKGEGLSLQNISGDDGETLSVESIFRDNQHSACHLVPRDRDPEYYLPMILSSGYMKSYTPQVKGILRGSPHGKDASPLGRSFVSESKKTAKESEIRALLHMLSGKVDSVSTWKAIGAVLKAEGMSRSVFESFSENCNTGVPVKRVWRNLENEFPGISVKTLKYMAMSASPELYEKYTETHRAKLLDAAIVSKSHTDVAKAFEAQFPFEFMCAEHKSGLWYRFDGVRWERSEGVELLTKITQEFVDVLSDLRREIINSNVQDRDVKAMNETSIQKIGALIKALGNHGFKSSVVKELKARYYNKHFLRLRDSNRYLTGCKNGVIDTSSGTAIFRKGRPEDYVTRTTRIPFTKIPDHSAEMKAYKKYMRQVFRDKGLRDYMYMFIASLLISGNLDKIVPDFLGTGDNSKSIIVRIIEAAFGTYIVKIPTSVLTEKRPDSTAANPALARTIGARMGIAQEASAREPMQSATIKELSGNDSMLVRDLWMKGTEMFEFVVSLILVIVSNSPPPIPDCQRAIWARMRRVDFTSTWVEPALAPVDEKEQFEKGIFPMDKNFEDNIPDLGRAMLAKAFADYQEYAAHGLQEPKSVAMASEKYRVENNSYIGFWRDKMAPVTSDEDGKVLDKGAKVTIRETYTAFKEWYKMNFNGQCPGIKDFKINVETTIKQNAVENKWYGYRLVDQSSEMISLMSI